MRQMVGGLVVFALVLGAATVGFGDDKEKPKYTIKEVMAKAQKSGLCAKAAKGEASKAEKEQLVEYYTALGLNAPPKGDEKEWKEVTKAMLEAAKAVAKDEPGAAAKLKKTAGDCKTCHGKFKS